MNTENPEDLRCVHVKSSLQNVRSKLILWQTQKTDKLLDRNGVIMMMRPSIFSDNFEMMNGFFDDSFWERRSGLRTMTTMATDIFETDDGYEIEMDLPGFPKESIKAELRDGYLTILASYTGKDNAGRKGSYIKKERYSGHYKRSFYVGKKVSEQDIKARFANGVLSVYVPKMDKQPQVEEKKIISIEG